MRASELWLRDVLMHLQEGTGNTVRFIIQWGKVIKGSVNRPLNHRL